MLRLARLLNDLVDLGALQSGAFRLQVSAVNLREMGEACLETVRPQARQKGLALDFAIGTGVPTMVQADEERLCHVLLILLDNAIANTASGKVSLAALCGSSAPGEVLGGKTPALSGAFLELQVTDSGPGLSEEDRGKILQLFSRLEKANRGVGSGVRLSLAAHLCKAMGGSLHVRSGDSGQGTSFVVRLPMGLFADAPANATSELVTAMPGGA